MNNLKTEKPSFSGSLLYKATATWISLMNYKYDFTYGYKKKLHTISLSFTPDEYYHLSGFHYLDDLAIPRYTAEKLLTNIMNGIITQAQIEKSNNYINMVKPRLSAIACLDEILTSEFALYSYKPNMYPFYTNLTADYIITSHKDNVIFVFLIGQNQTEVISKCICTSAFTKGERDYTTNQRSYTLLKKARLNISSNISETLYIKDGFNDPTIPPTPIQQ